MSDIKPTGPSLPGKQKPEELQSEKPDKTTPPPNESGDETYLGFTFTSQKAYLEFKGKFLSRMANEMIRQIQRESDRMVQALKKMREDQ